MHEPPEDGERRTALAAVVGMTAALVSVGGVAAIGVLVSTIGLLTIGRDSTAASLYAGGLGAGLVSLLALGVVAGARSRAARAADRVRLLRRLEIHADRLEAIAGELRPDARWPPDELSDELRLGEQAYAVALEAGATEHARRLSHVLAYVRARGGVSQRGPEPWAEP